MREILIREMLWMLYLLSGIAVCVYATPIVENIAAWYGRKSGILPRKNERDSATKKGK